MFTCNVTTTTNTKYILSENIPIVISQYTD